MRRVIGRMKVRESNYINYNGEFSMMLYVFFTTVIIGLVWKLHLMVLKQSVSSYKPIGHLDLRVLV